jgi:branched-chain amino acid transport system substrate-binding protein
MGGQVVVEIPYVRGSSDFKNSIVKLKSEEIDGIYVVGYDKAMGLIPKQLREMGIEQQILANASAATPAYTRIAGEAAEGIVLMNFAFSTRNPRTEEGKQLVERYRERFGDTPLVLTVIGNDIVGLLAKAIETRGASADEIRDGLLAIEDYDGVIGKLTVRSDGEVDLPLMPLIIRGGKPTPFVASPGR